MEIMENEMSSPQKASLSLGLMLILVQNLEDLIDDGFGKIFTGTMKNDCNKLIRRFDNCIDKICVNGDDGTNQQVQDVYSYLMDMIGSIPWEGEMNNKIKKDE